MAAMRRHVFFASLFALLAALAVGGSALAQADGEPMGPLAYYWQALKGHLTLINRARPVQDWLSDPATPEPLRARLRLAQQIRDHASQQLALPDNASYRRYADIGSTAAVWNVVAAPELSLQPKTWCFMVVGCVSYRGFYARDDAQAEAAQLVAQGFDVTVYPVPAYSTLGHLNWAGGDPLLSTFIRYPAGEQARLIFHELAHQQVYVRDDSTFNESYASAVEQLGVAQWLASQATDTERQQYQQHDQRRQAFRQLMQRTRHALQQVYQSAASPERQRELKVHTLKQMKDEYTRLKTTWPAHPAYDAWVASAGNAHFASSDTYEKWVNAFERLHQQCQQTQPATPWPCFHAKARELAQLDGAERQFRLQQLSETQP